MFVACKQQNQVRVVRFVFFFFYLCLNFLPDICFVQQLTGFQSNGPGLEYKVQWRQKDVDEDWSSKNVANVSEFVVPGTPTYVPYEITVQAVNDYGDGPQPDVVIGYSGEDCESTFWDGLCVWASGHLKPL